MVSESNKVETVFDAKTKGFEDGVKRVNKGLVSAHKTVVKVERDIKRIGDTTVATTSKFNAWGRQVGKSVKSITTDTGRFKMEWLSVMFFSMMVFKQTTKLIKSLISGYRELTEGAITPLTTAFTRLEANTKFLKFQLLDALSPILVPFIDFISGLALGLAKMDPNKLKLIGLGIAAIAGISGLASFGAQLMLFWGGLKMLLGGMAGAEAASGIAALTSLAGVLTVLSGIGLITITLAAIMPAEMRGKLFEFLDKFGVAGDILTITIEFVALGINTLKAIWNDVIPAWKEVWNDWVDNFVPEWVQRMGQAIKNAIGSAIGAGAFGTAAQVGKGILNIFGGGDEGDTTSTGKISELANDIRSTYSDINKTMQDSQPIQADYIESQETEIEVMGRLNESLQETEDRYRTLIALKEDFSAAARGVD